VTSIGNYALYKTKKQTFILIPTNKGFGYNASLSNGYEIDNTSADHCQEGTEKKILYAIKTCSGNGEDLCWPVNTKLSLELVEDFDMIDTTDTRTKSPIDYFQELITFIKSYRNEYLSSEDTHLQNIIDEVVALIYRTLYKLKYNK
jgi:hypothetical protein